MGAYRFPSAKVVKNSESSYFMTKKFAESWEIVVNFAYARQSRIPVPGFFDF